MTRKRAKARRSKSTAQTGLACVILAAGQGTRMRSARSKVLHEVLGRPLVAYPVELAQSLGAKPVVLVLGHQREDVEAVLVRRFGDEALRVVEQKQRRGTGHAVATAGSCSCSRGTCRSCSASP